jgi:DNA-binding transcriptional MerR regulator
MRIGEFSRVTRLTVKTIRLYHEEGLLPPAKVGASGYRYYDDVSVERARIIVELRKLDFSLAEIREILAAGEDEGDILGHLERQLGSVEKKLETYREVRRALSNIIASEKEAILKSKESFEVGEKNLEPQWIAGIRTKGRYAECGKLFGKLGRSMGRWIRGKPFNLYYDGEHKEEDADFESCFPVRQGARGGDGVSIRELPGARCASLLHRGPYDELGRSYQKVFQYLERKGLKAGLPCREVYLKGPGMIFRGNPRKYLTEIQVPVEA